MNRLVLIGNGFDIAHGLKTSYADFINWYWGKWGDRLLRSDKEYTNPYETMTMRRSAPFPRGRELRT